MFVLGLMKIFATLSCLYEVSAHNTHSLLVPEMRGVMFDFFFTL